MKVATSSAPVRSLRNGRPKVLAVKLRAIGDTVIWTSSLGSFRKALPDAEIHALTFSANEAVLRGNPDIDRVHFLKTSSRWEMVRKFLSLRKERFDLLLVFHSYAAISRWHWLVGAGTKAIYHYGRKESPLGCVPIPDAGVPEDAIAKDLRVLRAVGMEPLPHPTGILLTEAESRRAEEAMAGAISRCEGDPSKPRYLFLPGASHPLRRYPKERLLSLASQVLAHGCFQPVILADSDLSKEWNLPEECRSLGIPLLAGGSLREFIVLVSRGERAVANDSGPAHIAVALGLRTTFLFGPGSAAEWHPYDRLRHPMMRIEVPCRTNGPQDRELFRTCGDALCVHQKCMRDLRVTLDDLLG
jgi:ADP-heptose:LPS heptosyltransferase